MKHTTTQPTARRQRKSPVNQTLPQAPQHPTTLRTTSTEALATPTTPSNTQQTKKTHRPNPPQSQTQQANKTQHESIPLQSNRVSPKQAQSQPIHFQQHACTVDYRKSASSCRQCAHGDAPPNPAATTPTRHTTPTKPPDPTSILQRKSLQPPECTIPGPSHQHHTHMPPHQPTTRPTKPKQAPVRQHNTTPPAATTPTRQRTIEARSMI